MPAMIEKIDQEIREWISSTITDTEVVLGLPNDNAEDEQVGLYLMDLSQGNCARVGKIPPLKIDLRYLVTVKSPRTEQAHRILGELILAAIKKPPKEPPEF